MLQRLEVNHFLFCWTLRLGSLVLGNVLLILNFLLMVVALMQYDLVLGGSYRSDMDTLRSLFSALISIAAIGIPVSILLIIGVIYNKRVLLLPYLVLLAVLALGLLVGSVVLPVMVGLATAWMALPWGICFLLLGGLSLVVHSWLVVFSFHIELGRGEDDATEMKVHDSSPRAEVREA